MTPGDIVPTDRADTYFLILAVSNTKHFPFVIVHAVTTIPRVVGNQMTVFETKKREVYGLPYIDFINIKELENRGAVDQVESQMLESILATPGLLETAVNLFDQYRQRQQAARDA